MHRLAAAALILLAACGDNGEVTPDAGPDGPGVEDPCPPLELGKPRLQFDLFNQLTGVRYPLSGDLEGWYFFVEMYGQFSGGFELPPLMNGSFDLTTPPNDNLETCQHCAFIGRDNPDGTLEIKYYQAQGSMSLTSVTDPLDPVFIGSVSVQVHEATANEVGHTTFVPNGKCRRVEALAFDTTPIGGPCNTLNDCANELLEVCDPDSQLCQAPECDFENGGCTDDQSCVNQNPILLHGACYDNCNPNVAASCDPGYTCWQTGPQPNIGLCLRTGDGEVGEACEVADSSTSCSGDLVCSRDSETCTTSCDLFDTGATGCDPSTRCSLYGRCEPPSTGDPAQFGEACGEGAYQASPCAVDSTGFQGYCFAYEPEDPLTCIEACLDDTDCAAAQYCALRFTSGLGTCLPDPVCGDGALGEVGEVCDDGDTMGGTCSADCQTVDYALSCDEARPLTSGTTVTGDTRTALDGFMVSCQVGRARTELYEFDPATPGRLTVTVTGATTNAVSVMNTCGEIPDELACGSIDPLFPQTVVTQLTTADPVTIGVAGFTVLDEAAHSIRVDFVAEDCGDSIIAGREVCDDGNETSNDGCSADCRTIEYTAICANATPLSTTTPNTGDTSTAPFLFENSCSADVTGRDRVYTFTAPANGTLGLSLDQGNADLALVVFDGCGAPPLTELACSSVYGTEEATVQMTQGQRVTVVVDGFLQTSAGPYTLNATFQ